MFIDHKKIIQKVSKAQGLNLKEAENAADMFFKIISRKIAEEDPQIFEIKHLGKFTPKKDGPSNT